MTTKLALLLYFIDLCRQRASYFLRLSGRHLYVASYILRYILVTLKLFEKHASWSRGTMDDDERQCTTNVGQEACFPPKVLAAMLVRHKMGNRLAIYSSAVDATQRGAISWALCGEAIVEKICVKL